MAWVTCVESVPMVSWIGTSGAAPTRFSVTPGMAPVRVLLALLKGIPSMVKAAFVPPAGGLKFRLVLLLEMANALALPVDWLTTASREPVASVATLALTPQFWLLMYLAKVVSVSLLPGVIVMACVV